MKKIALTCFILMLFFPTLGFSDSFNFYGISFGNTKDEVGKVFKIKNEYGFHGTENPGHGIHKLYYGFDNNQKLFYLEIYYALGNSNEENEALILALDQRFMQPLKSQPDIEVKIDTFTDTGRYGSGKYTIIKLTHKSIRNTYLDFLKKEWLRKME